MASPDPGSPAQPAGKPGRSGATGWEALIPLEWDRLRDLTNEPVPYHLKRWWFCLGGTPAYLLLIQITTGILLTFYYQPSPDHAYESVRRITYEVPFGSLIRGVHKWSGNLMIVAVILHMLRVFFTGAYRHPRLLNWVFGAMLLCITLTFGFTGYSLVYEQLSFWGTTVASNLTESIPLIGRALATFLRGGPEIGSTTLTRLYVLHIGVLPAVMIAVLGLHITMIRLHGVTEFEFEKGQASLTAARSALGFVPWLLVLVCMAGIIGTVSAALLGRPTFELIGYAFTPGASRLIWAIIAIALAAAGYALWRRHLAGLMLFLTACLLAMGRIARDLMLGETAAPGLWIGLGGALAALLVLAVISHHRFSHSAKPDEPTHYNFFPDHVLTELLIGTGLLVLLTLLTLVFPVGLGEKADVNLTPEHIKPEWYFYFQFRLLKLSPGLAGLTALQVSVILTGLVLATLFLWPWIDRVLERIAPGKDISVYIGVAGFLWFLAFTVWEAMAE